MVVGELNLTFRRILFDSQNFRILTLIKFYMKPTFPISLRISEDLGILGKKTVLYF